MKKIIFVIVIVAVLAGGIYLATVLIKNKKTPDRNLITCPSVYKPVCGVDGKSYNNACNAYKKNIKVKSVGLCQ